MPLVVDPTLFDPDVFWQNVRGDRDCWVWIGPRAANGYGIVNGYHFTERFAHRLSWTMANGPIPSGLWVLHSCDNKPCVNPEHLFLGTALDNAHDRDRKGHYRARGPSRSRLTHCKALGHELTDADRRDGCRVCRKLRARAYRAAARIPVSGAS